MRCCFCSSLMRCSFCSLLLTMRHNEGIQSESQCSYNAFICMHIALHCLRLHALLHHTCIVTPRNSSLQLHAFPIFAVFVVICIYFRKLSFPSVLVIYLHCHYLFPFLHLLSLSPFASIAVICFSFSYLSSLPSFIFFSSFAFIIVICFNCCHLIQFQLLIFIAIIYFLSFICFSFSYLSSLPSFISFPSLAFIITICFNCFFFA